MEVAFWQSATARRNGFRSATNGAGCDRRRRLQTAFALWFELPPRQQHEIGGTCGQPAAGEAIAPCRMSTAIVFAPGPT